MFYSAKSQSAVDATVTPFHVRADPEAISTLLRGLTAAQRATCVEYALANGLLRLLAARLEEMGCLPDLPRDFAEPLAAALAEGERLGRAQRAEALEVTSALQSEGVTPLVLKGAALEQLLYARIGVRPMRDLDLLFEPSDCARASHLLERLGFSALPGAHEPDHHLPRMLRARADGTQFAIDLHHRLVPPSIYGIRVGELDGLWERSIWLDAESGVRLRTLSLEDHVLHLHLHLFHHLFYNFRLMHLVDIVLAARSWKESVDWAGVAERLRQLGLSQFRRDLWSWIEKHFGDALSPDAAPSDPRTSELGGWLLRHGSLPAFAGLRYSKSAAESAAALASECRRYVYRSLCAPGWGFLGSRSC